MSYLLSTITQEGEILILIVQVRRCAFREPCGRTAVNDNVRIHVQVCLSSVCGASFEMVPLASQVSLCSASIPHPQTLAQQSLLPAALLTVQKTLLNSMLSLFWTCRCVVLIDVCFIPMLHYFILMYLAFLTGY